MDLSIRYSLSSKLYCILLDHRSHMGHLVIASQMEWSNGMVSTISNSSIPMLRHQEHDHNQPMIRQEYANHCYRGPRQVVQLNKVTQDNINLNLLSGAIEGNVVPLAARQMWENISIKNRKPLPNGNIKFSYLSPTGLITDQAS
jgi:hypothetical protein